MCRVMSQVISCYVSCHVSSNVMLCVVSCLKECIVMCRVMSQVMSCYVSCHVSSNVMLCRMKMSILQKKQKWNNLNVKACFPYNFSPLKMYMYLLCRQKYKTCNLSLRCLILCCIVSYRAVPFRAVSCRVMCRVMSQVMSCYVSCRVMSQVMSCYVSCHVSSNVMLCRMKMSILQKKQKWNNLNVKEIGSYIDIDLDIIHLLTSSHSNSVWLKCY